MKLSRDFGIVGNFRPTPTKMFGTGAVVMLCFADPFTATVLWFCWARNQ